MLLGIYTPRGTVVHLVHEGAERTVCERGHGLNPRYIALPATMWPDMSQRLTTPDKANCVFCKRITCHSCGKRHEATYSHEGQFGEGAVFEVICPKDNLSDFYTAAAFR